MVLTVTEDTPADMLAGSMELIVQLPRDHNVHAERVTVERSTAMMDLLVQIATAHKLAASSYTLQAIGERGRILPHQPNTPIGALDALEVKLLPKQGTFIPRKTKQASQPFETTFRLQVHLPRNQLYVSRVSPKTNLGEILSEVCREKNLDKNKYELRHPGNHKEVLDLSLSLQDYQLQEVTLYAKQGQSLSSALSSQDIMALQRQEERRRHQAKQSIFGFMFKKSSKESSSVSTESGSYGARSVSPARSDDTGRSISPLVAPVPTRPLRKRRPAPNPPTRQSARENDVVNAKSNNKDCQTTEDKLVITHSRNSSDSSGYHEASVLSDNPDSAGRMPETLPRRARPPSTKLEPRKLAHTSQASKSLCNLAISSGGLSHANSNTSLSSTGIRKKRAAPQPPVSRPLSSAISSQALERIVDSEESLTSDMGVSKPPSDIAASSETETHSKANSDIVVGSHTIKTIADFNRGSFDTTLKRDLAKLSCKESSQIEASEPIKVPIPIEVSVVIEKKSPVEKTSTPVEKVQMPVPVETVSPEENNYLDARIKRAGIAPIPKPRSKGPVVPKRVSSALSSPIVSANEDNEQVDARAEVIADSTKAEEEKMETYDPSAALNLAGVTGKSSSALNLDFSSRLPDMEPAARTKLDVESPWNALSSSNTPNEEQYQPFITTGTNLTQPVEEKLTHSTQPEEEGDSHSQGTGKAGNESQTEIDRLLQKVSTTLANVVPSEERAASEIKTTDPEKIEPVEFNKTQDTKSYNNNNTSNDTLEPQNSTFNSQQDTSDYVSANGEDLSGTDWEYQLPDPPSAFRDDTTLGSAEDYDGYDTITLRSVEAFKDPIAIDVDVTDKSCKKADDLVDKQSDNQRSVDNKADEFEVELRRNVITELESKIENGILNQGNKSEDSRKSSIETSTPKVAPIENTLPNFTITTYQRQKSLNIFDSKESTPKTVNRAEERIVKTFATLSRNINGNSISKFSNNNNKDYKESKEEKEVKEKESPRESLTNPVHRSKSYIVLTNNSKYRESKSVDVIDSSNMIKSTSVTNLNGDNSWSLETNGVDTKTANYSKILNKNCPERELQSVQVLKSILPQLKSTQDDKFVDGNKNKSKNDKSGQVSQVKLNVDDKSVVEELPERKSEPEEIKRYRYTGPPAISLGSWSERPRVNVQIKMDTDYKFGFNTNTSGNKTLVNLNSSTSDTVNSNNYSNNYIKSLPKSIGSNDNSNKRVDSKVSTYSGGINNNINVNNADFELKRFNAAKLHTRRKDEDKPVVTNVELKKSYNDKPEFKITDDYNDNDGDNKIDTRPVNFKELTQAFGKVNLRSKPSKFNSSGNVNRYSDIFDGRYHSTDTVNKIPIKVSTANGPLKTPTANGNIKKYTSVVDIDTHHLTNGLTGPKKFNNTITKLNGPATAPKGFKIQLTEAKNNFVEEQRVSVNKSQVPPPPTMPIITGVTLKNNNCRSARPVSMPVGKDPRDQLLESIRCFGRDKLRNVSTVS